MSTPRPTPLGGPSAASPTLNFHRNMCVRSVKSHGVAVTAGDASRVASASSSHLESASRRLSSSYLLGQWESAPVRVRHGGNALNRTSTVQPTKLSQTHPAMSAARRSSCIARVQDSVSESRALAAYPCLYPKKIIFPAHGVVQSDNGGQCSVSLAHA